MGGWFQHGRVRLLWLVPPVQALDEPADECWPHNANQLVSRPSSLSSCRSRTFLCQGPLYSPSSETKARAERLT